MAKKNNKKLIEKFLNKDISRRELIIQANSRGLLDERQEAEFRMIRVLQRNLLLAGQSINPHVHFYTTDGAQRIAPDGSLVSLKNPAGHWWLIDDFTK
jgi:hypothetical protein